MSQFCHKINLGEVPCLSETSFVGTTTSGGCTKFIRKFYGPLTNERIVTPFVCLKLSTLCVVLKRQFDKWVRNLRK